MSVQWFFFFRNSLDVIRLRLSSFRSFLSFCHVAWHVPPAPPILLYDIILSRVNQRKSVFLSFFFLRFQCSWIFLKKCNHSKLLLMFPNALYSQSSLFSVSANKCSSVENLLYLSCSRRSLCADYQVAVLLTVSVRCVYICAVLPLH